MILPLTVLRRLDCVLEPTKQAVLERHAQLGGQGREPRAGPAGGRRASSSTTPRSSTSASCSTTRRTSPTTCAPTSPASRRARADVLDKFDFDDPDRPARPSRTCSTWSSSKFAEIDLHPEAVSNLEMGYLYEELIRRFSELSNETAGEHFTPREVIRLMVNLLFIEDDDAAHQAGRSSRRCSTRPAAPAGCCRSPRTTCAR